MPASTASCAATSALPRDRLLRGYACEALARAAMVGGDRAAVVRLKREAHLLATQVEDTDDRALLVNDLNSIS